MKMSKEQLMKLQQLKNNKEALIKKKTSEIKITDSITINIKKDGN